MRLLMLLGMFLAATWAAAQPGASDLERLQGRWRVVGITVQQKPAPAEFIEKAAMTITFEGNEYTERLKGEVAEEGTMMLDATKSPRQLDIRVGSGKDKGKTQLGIYQLEGDTLTVAIEPAGGSERPTGFTTTPTSTFGVQVLKREKK